MTAVAPAGPTGLCTGFHGGGARSTVPFRPAEADWGRVHTLNDPTGACASGSSKSRATISRAAFPGPGSAASLKSRDAWPARFLTVTKNEILYSLNTPESFILAIVECLSDGAHQVHSLRRPFEGRGVTTDFNGSTVS